MCVYQKARHFSVGKNTVLGSRVLKLLPFIVKSTPEIVGPDAAGRDDGGEDGRHEDGLRLLVRLLLVAGKDIRSIVKLVLVQYFIPVGVKPLSQHEKTSKLRPTRSNEKLFLSKLDHFALVYNLGGKTV